MLGGRAWRLTTRLGPAECVDRLRSAIDGEFAFSGSKPVMGRVGSQAATLRKRVRYRNPFQAVVSVVVYPQGEITSLACRARLSWSTLIFGAVWGGATFLISAGAIYLLLTGVATPTPGTPLVVAVLPPSAMLAFAFSLPLLGRHYLRKDTKFLADFLDTLFEKA